MELPFTSAGELDSAGCAPTPGSGPYWGFDSFDAYYANWSKDQIGAMPKDHIWERMMKFVREKEYESVIRFFERQKPSYRTSPTWYFVIPECRAMIPPEMLSIADRCGAGVQNDELARTEGGKKS